MTHKLKRETFSQKIEHSGGVILLPLTPLFKVQSHGAYDRLRPVYDLYETSRVR